MIAEDKVQITFPAAMQLVGSDYGLTIQASSNLVENDMRDEPEGSQIKIVGTI